MSSIEKTAYPRFPKRKKIKPEELNRSYSLQKDEVSMINLSAKKDKLRLNLAIQLKTFQRLGYFIEIDKIPSEIIVHIRQSLKYHHRLSPGYANQRSLYRHRQKIREFLNVKRWGCEELYKISKEFIDVEDFHSKSERGVKQECYAHMLLINLARIFEAEADKQLPPPPIEHHPKKNTDDLKNSYWKNFCGEIKNFKVNFKNCLLVVGRSLEKLLYSVIDEDVGFISNILKSISRVCQKIRPGRHSPRQSRKPINKWKNSTGEKVTYA